MTFLAGLWGRVQIWAALAGAVLFAIGVAFVRGKMAGRSEFERRRDAARIKAMKDRRDVDDEVDHMGVGDLDSEYRRWLRDD